MKYFLILGLALTAGFLSYRLLYATENKKTMKYLAILEKADGVGMVDFAPHVKSEADQVWKLYQEEKIPEMYFVEGQIKPLIMLRASSQQEAKELIESLPMVKNNLFTVQLLPLAPYDHLHEHLKKSNAERPSWWPTDNF